MSQPTGATRTLGPDYCLHPLFSLHQAHRYSHTLGCGSGAGGDVKVFAASSLP